MSKKVKSIGNLVAKCTTSKLIKKANIVSIDDEFITLRIKRFGSHKHDIKTFPLVNVVSIYGETCNSIADLQGEVEVYLEPTIQKVDAFYDGECSVSPEGFFCCSNEENVLFVNPEFGEMTEIDPTDRKKGESAEDDDEPKKKKVVDDDDDDEPAPKKKKKAYDDDDEPAPKKKKKADDDDDEPAPKKKKKADDDDDEPAPKKKKKADDDDDEPAPKKKKHVAIEDDWENDD